jgi:hypothetical protein
MTIVTRESLQQMLDNENQQYVTVVVGRALVALMQRQTEVERKGNATEVENGIGFSGADARAGTLGAKSFLKNKTLLDWQVAQWTKKGKTGYARICKYWKQLNEIAEAKAKGV